MRIGLLLYPNLTQLDLTGPLAVFALIPKAQVSLIWKTKEPVTCASGFQMIPTASFEETQALDIICVPGGPGQIELMDDTETLDFLRRIAPGCQWVTSVCVGSLVLAAAGLLSGKRAACHWASLDQLALFGATPVKDRVVQDGQVMTGAGVTSGIDFALTLVAKAINVPLAKELQLLLQYDPQPPFVGGSPDDSDPATVKTVDALIATLIARRLVASQAAAARLNAV